jgi:hypothetical protein
MKFAMDAKDLISVNTNFMNQVVDNWKTPPFTDITVTTGSACPLSHPYPVFDRVFYGTE